MVYKEEEDEKNVEENVQRQPRTCTKTREREGKERERDFFSLFSFLLFPLNELSQVPTFRIQRSGD